MPEGRFGPEVIVGSRYLEEQELTATARVFLCLGLAVMLVVWLVALLLNPGLPPAAWWRLASAPLVGLPALGVVLAVFWRRAVRFGQGRVGEERVVEALRVALDHRWTIFRNLRLPPRKDDLDVVLIGPGGVWVLEIKAYGGRVRVQGDRWECLRWGQWQPLPANPSRQARGNARRLREWLQQEGVDLRWVQPGVVLARRQRVEDVREADPPVWRLASLRTEVAVCVARWVLSPEMNAQIVGVLSGEAERQRAREEAT